MRKVLVVEDEVLIRLTLVDALQEAGFDVLDTGSAEHAIEIINEQTIHLLFTDIQLPGKLTGLDLAHRVFERFPDAGIVVASGRIQPMSTDLPPAAKFFSKPFGFDEIIACFKGMNRP
ncbi:response regulator [Shinella sp. AETb1-6]|uniref:response regulator n=1 Tax=Shinella sp. AETb1-6 TaxID=2692210 RepID=UPI00136D0752|nr:response regulator [Shinella sp. AETb1-6]